MSNAGSVIKNKEICYLYCADDQCQRIENIVKQFNVDKILKDNCSLLVRRFDYEKIYRHPSVIIFENHIEIGKSFVLTRENIRSESGAVFRELRNNLATTCQKIFESLVGKIGISAKDYDLKIVLGKLSEEEKAEVSDLMPFAGSFFRATKWVAKQGDINWVLSMERRKFLISEVEHSAESTQQLTSRVVIESAKKIKVFIVDDSKTIVNLLSKVIAKDPQMEIVGTCLDPSLAAAEIRRLKPDVMTLDIHMPKMTGVDLLRQLPPELKIPALLITSLSINEGTLVLDALELGAFDYIQKPSMENLAETASLILLKLRAAFELQLKNKQQGIALSETTNGMKKISANTISNSKYRTSGLMNSFVTPHHNKLLLLGASTGGTNALTDLLKKFPKEIPPTLIVQHIPAVFSLAFAKRLNELCPFEVKESEDGDELKPNRVIVARGGIQVGVEHKNGKYFIQHRDDPPVNRFKPSVDYMYQSVLNQVKSQTHLVAAIFTGMGNDGAKGMKSLFDRGVYTLAQDEASCVVYGMPREAIELGGVSEVVHLQEMHLAIMHAFSKHSKLSLKAC